MVFLSAVSYGHSVQLDPNVALSLEEGLEVSTIEHLVSALAALGVDNVLIDVDGPEIPIKDGSSIFFVEQIKKAGIKVFTGTSVESVDTSGDGCKVLIKTKKGEETLECDIVLSASRGIQERIVGSEKTELYYLIRRAIEGGNIKPVFVAGGKVAVVGERDTGLEQDAPTNALVTISIPHHEVHEGENLESELCAIVKRQLHERLE